MTIDEVRQAHRDGIPCEVYVDDHWRSYHIVGWFPFSIQLIDVGTYTVKGWILNRYSRGTFEVELLGVEELQQKVRYTP